MPLTLQVMGSLCGVRVAVYAGATAIEVDSLTLSGQEVLCCGGFLKASKQKVDLLSSLGNGDEGVRTRLWCSLE